METISQLPLIDARIQTLVQEAVHLPDDPTLAEPCNSILKSVFHEAQLSNSSGKRLRALLTLASYQAFSTTPEEFQPDAVSSRQLTSAITTTGRNVEPTQNQAAILDLACAIEIFQTSALIHDDIIDESALRRGMPSAHAALSKTLGNTRLGNGLALMLGDMLATASVRIARQSCHTHANMGELIACFLNMQHEVETGQLLDLAVELTSLENPEQLKHTAISVSRWKTASYTTISPIELGALYAGVSAEQARDIALRVGQPLGVAFQLADDLLDVLSSSQRTGKPVGGDIIEGKRTVLLADALTAGTQYEQAQLRGIYSKPERSEEDVHLVTELYRATGAIKQSQLRIQELWQESSQAIRSLPLPDETKQVFTQSCHVFLPEFQA